MKIVIKVASPRNQVLNRILRSKKNVKHSDERFPTRAQRKQAAFRSEKPFALGLI
jgi:hypothetical protein